MQVQTFCWLPLRRGTFIISAACFVMSVLNIVSAAVPQDEAQPQITIVSRSVHAVLAVVYAASGTLLAFALFLGSLSLVRLWLALFSVVTLASLLAHDLARYDWMTLEQDSSAAVVAGIGLLNIVLDVVFLMAVFSLMREMERQKAEDVEAALRPRPRATPGAPSVAPALPLKDLVPRAHVGPPEDTLPTDNNASTVGRTDGRSVGNAGGYVGDAESPEDAALSDGDCSGTESAFESHAYSARRGGKVNEKRLSRDSGWEVM